MGRIAVIGTHPASLRTAEHLVNAGMCVDLFTNVTAPFGLVSRLPAKPGGRLRLFGNVRVGDDAAADISPVEIARLSAAKDPQVICEGLRARGVAFTTWEGTCAETAHDWNDIDRSAQLVPVCF